MHTTSPATTFAQAAGIPAPSMHSQGWALASLSLSMLLPSLAISIANVGLPTFAQAFGASFQQVQWVVLAYLLSSTALLVTAGRLGDGMGPRRLLLVGIALFVAASVACGIAPALWVLVAARAVQGMGAAIMLALTVAFVGATVPPERTGRAMGWLGTTSAIGTAIGPSLGGVLIAGFGWRALFLVSILPGVLAWILVRRHLPADEARAERRPVRIDYPGTLLLTLTLVTYALAMTIARGRPGQAGLLWLLVAALGGGLFVFIETKTSAPLVRLSMLRDRVLSASLGMSALVATVVMATLVVGPFYLTQTLGLDAAVVGLVLSVGPIVAALVGIPVGRAVDRYGAPFATRAGLFGMGLGTLLLAVVPASLGLVGYIAPIVALTAGYALFQAANNTAVMAGVGPGQRGVISGLLNLSRNLGLITGASLMGAVFNYAAAAADTGATSPQAVATGMRATFAVALFLVIGALALASRQRGNGT